MYIWCCNCIMRMQQPLRVQHVCYAVRQVPSDAEHELDGKNHKSAVLVFLNCRASEANPAAAAVLL